MKRAREEGNIVLQGTTVRKPQVHKNQLKSEIRMPSRKGKDVYTNERTHFPFLK